MHRVAVGAAMELRELRRAWDAGEPETERAIIVSLAFLKEIDAGDTEATIHRLWRRAVRLLQEPPGREQLDRLARRLLKVKRMVREEVNLFLKH